MKKSTARTLLISLFIFIGCFGAAYAAAGMLTALPAPAIGGTCGPSTGSETAAEALAKPSSIGAGPEPATSNVTAHHQWETFIQQCQSLADRRGLASLAVLVISLAVAGVGLFWVLRKPRKDGDDGSSELDGPADGDALPGGDPSAPAYTPLGLHDPALVGAGVAAGPAADQGAPPASAVWPSAQPPAYAPPGAYPPQPYPGTPADGYPQPYPPQGYPPSPYPPQGYPPVPGQPAGYPAGYAEPAPYYPQPTYPPPGYTQQAYPPSAYPAPGDPQQGYPTQGYPPSPYPASSYPQPEQQAWTVAPTPPPAGPPAAAEPEAVEPGSSATPLPPAASSDTDDGVAPTS